MDLLLSDADFNRMSTFIHKNYGIDLSKKRQLISSRLSHTLQTKGYSDFTTFIDDLMAKKDPSHIELVINKLTTNYTYFMREQEHFDFFVKTILPDITRRHQADRTLSIWSAGCSSGEEPYNISMYIKDFLGSQADSWDARVLATDISQKALASAKEGIYELPDTIPSEWRRKYFTPAPGKSSEHFQVAPAIRDNVVFRTFNLMNPIRIPAKFDVIFCRNVMIYFDQPTKDALIKRYFDASAPGGYLLIGHSETLNRDIGYQFLAPSTFRKPPR